MKTVEAQSETFVRNLSVLTFLSGVFVIGVGGLAMLSLVAYAMVSGNLALGLVCGALLVSPYIAGIAWFSGLTVVLASDRFRESSEKLAGAASRSTI